MRKYQENLSLDSPVLLDISHKQSKVDKVISILEDDGALRYPGGIALDVGCSIGFFARALTPYFKIVFGLDIDVNALAQVQKDSGSPIDNLQFLTADSLLLPFEDNSIDLILCNHTYEHVPDADVLFSEIWRVLKPGGRCYLGAASRLTLIEPHYHLVFLSWLPKPLAHKYMRLMNKGDEYYEMLRTYWGIKRLIRNFHVTDYTLKVLRDPGKFAARDMIPEGSWIEKVPVFFWRVVYPFLPSYIFILRKAG